MPPCEVRGCPSLAAPGDTKCSPHQQGVVASSVAAAGRKCLHCARLLLKDDMVRRAEKPARKRGELMVSGYAHVACPLPRPRRVAAGPGLPFDEHQLAERTDR